MIAFIVAAFFFLVGMELLIKFFSAIFGTIFFVAIIIILLLKGSMKK